MNLRNFIISLVAVVAAAVVAIVYFQSDVPSVSPVVAETKSVATQAAVMSPPGTDPVQSSRSQHDTSKLPAILPSTATPAEQQKWQILTEKLAAIRKESESLREELESTPASSQSKATVTPKPEFERIIKEAAFAEGLKRERANYADFITENGLDAGVAEQLIRLKTDTNVGIMLIARRKDEAGEDAITRSSAEEGGLAYHNQGRLKALLGEEKLKLLQDYDRTLLDRRRLRKFTSTLNDLGMPLNASQLQAALSVICEENLEQEKDFNSNSTRIIREQIIKRVTPLLSPEQRAVFEAEQKKWPSL